MRKSDGRYILGTWVPHYLHQSTGLNDHGIPLAVKAVPKENVFSKSAGEDPGVLGGIGDPPLTNVHLTIQWFQLSQKTLKKSGLGMREVRCVRKNQECV